MRIHVMESFCSQSYKVIAQIKSSFGSNDNNQRDLGENRTMAGGDFGAKHG